MTLDPTLKRTPSRFSRLNLWLSGRVWVPLGVLVASVLLLGIALLVIVGRVNDNATKLSELRYRSCIEDAVLDFKVAEGDAVFAAFNRDPDAVARALPAYGEAIERLRGAQTSCRAQYPDTRSSLPWTIRTGPSSSPS